MTIQTGDPGVFHRYESESRDGPFTSDEIAVQEFHRDGLARLYGVDDTCTSGIVRIAERPLPHADVARRDVQITRLKTEVFQWRMKRACRTVGVESDRPALTDGDAGTDVSRADGQVHRSVDLFDHGSTTRSAYPMATKEHDLLHRIVQAGRSEDRSSLLLQRDLRNSCRAVRRSNCGKGRHGEDERPGGGGERGGSRPVKSEDHGVVRAGKTAIDPDETNPRDVLWIIPSATTQGQQQFGSTTHSGKGPPGAPFGIIASEGCRPGFPAHYPRACRSLRTWPSRERTRGRPSEDRYRHRAHGRRSGFDHDP